MPSVKIRVERVQEEAGVGNINQKVTGDEKKNVAATSVFAHQMMGIGKQVFNYAATNVALYTGDYILQDKINMALDMVGDVATIGMGFATGNIAGGLVAIAGVTTKRVLQDMTDRRKDVMQERERNYWLQRSGNSTTNGSRGTEN